MRSCIVLFTTEPEYWDDEKQKPLHSYMGSFFGRNTVYYIKSYKNGEIDITYDKKDAMRFTSDDLCTECMEQIIATKNPWTIAVHSYNGDKAIAECVHYPNEHWGKNNNLQPSLMNMSVSDFCIKKGIW